jgi:hypothetical protein
MVSHIFPRVNGFVVDVYSRLHERLTVLYVQIEEALSNKQMIADGLTLFALCGYQKSALLTQ